MEIFNADIGAENITKSAFFHIACLRSFRKNVEKKVLISGVEENGVSKTAVFEEKRAKTFLHASCDGVSQNGTTKKKLENVLI